MIRDPRKEIFKVLGEVLLKSEEIKPSQDAKRRVLKKYNLLGTDVDRKITKFFYEIFRRMGIIDKIILKVTGARHVNILDPWFRQAMRIAVYFLVFYPNKEDMNKAKRQLYEWIHYNTHPGAAVMFRKLWEELEEEKEKYLQGFSEWELKYFIPEWYAKRIIQLIGEEEARKLFEYFMRVPKISVRVNILKTTPEEMKEILEKKYKKKVQFGKYLKVILKFDGPFNFDKSEEYQKGMIIVQEEAAALASIFLDPKPGQTVVDMCAAPGGKTEHMAELMRLEGRIYAFDIEDERIKRMKELLKRTGTDKIVKIYKKDARKAPDILGTEIADKVLLDVPCSSDGTLHKNPELRWRLREEKVEELAQLQRELLDAAAELVKPGGEILYCTCTLLKEEDEDNVEWFLKTHKDFELVPLPKNIGSPGFIPGTIRMWPHKEDTIGFFYAKFRKKK